MIVENKNVGHHVTGDFDLVTSGYTAEPVFVEGPEGELPSGEPWTAIQPRPWGELTVHIRTGGESRNPGGFALSTYAPQFGWDHKEFVRNGRGARNIMAWRCHFGAVPWAWRAMPGDGHIERYELDVPRTDAAIKQTLEVVRAWHSKMGVKIVKADFRDLSRPSTDVYPQHRVGSARAGSGPENSVCTSDFDCHDIDNLLFTSSATIPRTFFWCLGPTAMTAAYSYRRMIANHFSTGSSTKGYA